MYMTYLDFKDDEKYKEVFEIVCVPQTGRTFRVLMYRQKTIVDYKKICLFVKKKTRVPTEN